MSSSNSSDNPQRLTEKKKAEKELEALFQSLSLQPGEVKPPPRKTPGTSGRPTNFNTNIYQVQTAENAVVYRYDVSLSGRVIRGEREKVVDLTKRSDSSAVIADRMDQCRNAFRLIFNKNPNFFGTDPNAIFYDLQSILFSLKPLVIPPTHPSIQLVVDRGDCQVEIPGNLDRIIMEIKNVNERAQTIKLDDLSAIIREENLERDRSLLNFIELAVNQFPMFNDREFLTLKGSMVFFLNGADHSLPEKELDRGGTKYLASGIQKSATVIEGHKPKDGSGDPKQRKIGLMLEAKHSPFHSTIPLLDCIQRHNNSSALYPNFVRGQLVDQDLNKLGKIFKKMRLDVQYPDGRKRKIELKGFDSTTANTHIIKDLDTSVAAYFAEKYRELRFPDAHLVSVKQGANWNFYPPEFLYIADNQVVTSEQMDAFSKTSMIKACAVRPDHMERENKLAAEAIHLHNSEHSNGAGIRFSKNTLEVSGRVLPPPSVQYHNSAPVRVRENEAAWRMSRFYQPATFENFAVYMLKTVQDQQAMMTGNKFNAFIDNIKRFASNSGIQMGQCKDQGTYNDFEVEECVKYCADNNIQLCMFITPDFITNVHRVMKMCEHRYNVVTQDLKMKTAFKMIETNASATLENYMAKTNIKLGGLNHSVECQDPEIMNELKNTMFISISTNQPGSKSITDRVGSLKAQTPGVLGFCANYGQNYNSYMGDFYYTVAYRPEFYTELRKIFKLSVERFTANRGNPPTKILFYYSGASEGQFEAVYKNGVPLIKCGIQEGNNGNSIPLTILAVQKVNNVRLFPKRYPQSGKDHEFNVGHGTVVDQGIVSPVFNEFYLAAHSALKGTGRIPRYSIIFDESNYSMNLLEGVTHVLSYEHQIVSRATSLPTPVYVAEGYAQRGRDVYNAESRVEGPSLPVLDSGELDLEAMSDMFNYSKTDLINLRVNA